MDLHQVFEHQINCRQPRRRSDSALKVTVFVLATTFVVSMLDKFEFVRSLIA